MEYQGGDDLPKVDDIDRISEDGNNEFYDGFIGAEVKLRDVSGNPQIGKVLKHRKRKNMERIGIYHMNSFFNTHMYEVKLYDGYFHEVNSNKIVEAMFSHIDNG